MHQEKSSARVEFKLMLTQEISRSHEHLDNARKPRGTRKRSKMRVAVEFFETVFIGTKMRPRNELQRCCICGKITVFQGEVLDHSGAHAKWRSED